MAEQKKKKPFFNLSSKEWLGDPVTHFMKSGNAFRSDDNAELYKLASYIPKTSPQGKKVEYDISYDSPGDEIKGYKYTDLLTKAILLAPCNTRLATKNVRSAVQAGITPVGVKVYEQLRNNVADKYSLEDSDSFKVDELICLPGTNLLVKDWIDMGKIDSLVQGGAYVKLHPITAKVWDTMLTKRWKGKVIPSDVSLYPIMKNAKKVHFCMSSETGLSALLLGKSLGLIDAKDRKGFGTFESIYRGFDSCGVKASLPDKFKALLSHPEFGFLTVYHENPEGCVKAFFDKMSEYKHT